MKFYKLREFIKKNIINFDPYYKKNESRNDIKKKLMGERDRERRDERVRERDEGQKLSKKGQN